MLIGKYNKATNYCSLGPHLIIRETYYYRLYYTSKTRKHKSLSGTKIFNKTHSV